jgi:ABC transporter substrate binding protein
LPRLLDDLIRRRVAVIATPGSDPAALAAKSATTTIPIVFGVAEDPVTLGLVTSLSRPGGNATGINFFVGEIDAKRLALMHELLPQSPRFAVLLNPTNENSVRRTTKGLKEAADPLGLKVIFYNASNSNEIDLAFATLACEQAGVAVTLPKPQTSGAKSAGRTHDDRSLKAGDRKDLPLETHKQFSHLRPNVLKCRTCRARREVRLTCGCVSEGALPGDIRLAAITTRMFDEYFAGWKADRKAHGGSIAS